MLETKRFRCFEAKIQESELLATIRNRIQYTMFDLPVLCTSAMTTGQ